LGGRGGGSKEMAQGGPARIEDLEKVLLEIGARLRDQPPRTPGG